MLQCTLANFIKKPKTDSDSKSGNASELIKTAHTDNGSSINDQKKSEQPVTSNTHYDSNNNFTSGHGGDSDSSDCEHSDSGKFSEFLIHSLEYSTGHVTIVGQVTIL